MPDSVKRQKSRSTSAQSPIRPGAPLYRLLQTIARAVATRLTGENSNRISDADETFEEDGPKPEALNNS
jgi:tRNA A37 N6-isopentenylltransferase MiaA